MTLPVSVLAPARRVVVKVGSSLVTNDGRGLDASAVARWAGQIAALMADGKQVVLVSSGAIAEGIQRLGWAARPTEMHELQAAAAVGQMGLAHVYEREFAQLGLKTAQILLTHADLADRTRYLNARNTLLTLLGLGVVPIINENDTVVTDEIKVGDNDTLGALVTNLLDADVLVILTDQAGLYTADPRLDASATLVREARADDAQLTAMAGGAGSTLGKGGMITKVVAAQRAAASGAATVIASGREPEVLLRLARGECVGTQLLAGTQPLAARKQWLLGHLQFRGSVVVDEGAERVLRRDGASLLPVGVIEVEGDFVRGEVIAVKGRTGRELGRGVTNYSAAETRRIMRRASSDIASVLGYAEEPELVHRDQFVLVGR
ncbi:MAG: glutamate 5-kinase [Betaproteobacteria bacterium]|nr:glutamate 5-kinase [Betaproteobacteria bacterium]MDE2047019.1 glutamate 5-kinase [Betaproteobacteria bacterium]